MPPPGESSPARDAASAAAVDLIEPGMLLGLGSGRALWRVIDRIAERWPDGPPLKAVVAGELTRPRAEAAGIEIVELDGTTALDLAFDGADELDRDLRLIKGGGGALLREKLVIVAADRFVVVAETPKLVDRLGENFRLPVEVVRFAWADTRRRLSPLLPDAELRLADGEPFMTDEGHHILDCVLPPQDDLEAFGAELSQVPGVVEHGLFLQMAERAILGTPEGNVQELLRAR